MANKSGKNQDLGSFIYYRETGEKVRVNKEQHDAFYMDANRIRNKEMNHGRCVCPDYYVWACDGDCPGCRFRAEGDLLSLDATDQDGGSVFDTLPDESRPIDEVVADRDLINRLFDVLRKLDPDADTIIRLWEEHPEGISDREIERAIGRHHKTFVNQMKRYRSILRKYLDE